MATKAPITKPTPDEYSPYHERYISLVPEGNIIDILRQQMSAALEFFGSLTEEQVLHRYEPGKWSIKEVLGHIIDGERIFAYRALRFARNDQTPLAGFEQDDYVKFSNFDQQPLSDLINAYKHVRESSIGLFQSFTEEALDRKGIASKNEVSVRAIVWILCGHERHHIKVIKERYL